MSGQIQDDLVGVQAVAEATRVIASIIDISPRRKAGVCAIASRLAYRKAMTSRVNDAGKDTLGVPCLGLFNAKKLDDGQGQNLGDVYNMTGQHVLVFRVRPHTSRPGANAGHAQWGQVVQVGSHL